MSLSILKEKDNLFSNYYSAICNTYDYVLFIHNTYEFQLLRNKVCYPNQLQNVLVKNSLFKKSVIKKELKCFFQGSTICVGFSEILVLILFLVKFLLQHDSIQLKFISLGVFWVSRNRLLSMAYIINIYKELKAYIKLDNELTLVDLQKIYHVLCKILITKIFFNIILKLGFFLHLSFFSFKLLNLSLYLNVKKQKEFNANI